MPTDEKISESYRAIARETPGAGLDAAILAASRRALRPSAARRWGAPVSIAAVLVLAFGLTVEMRHEEPGVETSLPARPQSPPEPERPNAQVPASPPGQDKIAPVPQPQTVARPAKPRAAPAPAAKESKPATPFDKDKREAAPAALENAPAAFPAAPAATAGAPPAPLRAERPMARQPAAVEDLNVAPAYAPRAKASADSMQRAQGAIAIPPEMGELERIAQLRSEGRDVEADKALEDFRRAHPDYRIPEPMWERVKPR